MSLRCLFDTAGHLPDTITIVIHVSDENGSMEIPIAYNNDSAKVLRVPGTYLRSVNGKYVIGQVTIVDNELRCSESYRDIYAIADEYSSFIGEELALGTPDSCDNFMSEGCGPDDVRIDTINCGEDGSILVVPICFDGTKAMSIGDKITNLRQARIGNETGEKVCQVGAVAELTIVHVDVPCIGKDSAASELGDDHIIAAIPCVE